MQIRESHSGSLSINDLPTDLYMLILAHDAEKIALKKQIVKLNTIIDDFAKYTSLSTSCYNMSGRDIFLGKETQCLFGPPSDTPNIRALGETLFAQIKALDVTADHRNYMLWTEDDRKSGKYFASGDIWCIEDLRSDLFLYKYRA
jgi:hypothetical protein